MKMTIALLMAGVLPAMALASGEYAGGHDMHSGHDMAQLEHESHAMHGMTEDAHEDAAGRPGDPARVSRTIEVTMNDTMRFEPAAMRFKAGDTVRFAVRNDGRIRHEMVIGDRVELQEHAAMMRSMPGMQHSDPNMISLAPGQQAELVWQFDRPGHFEFACLVPGHLEAGMSGVIDVN